MKYYIVLEPISDTQPNSMFARPMDYDAESIYKKMISEKTIKLFENEQQAIDYVVSVSKVARPPKASGKIAPLITAELEEKISAPLTTTKCMVLDGQPHVEKCNPISIDISYYEVPGNSIPRKALIKAEFKVGKLQSIDMVERQKGCTIS